MVSVIGSASCLLSKLMGTYGKNRFNTLIYHRVLPDFDPMRPYEVTRDDFIWHMEVISKYFSPLSLDEALYLMERDELPEKAICVTFDDGYADNLDVALPILQKHSIPATVFVATEFLDGGRMWNDTVLEVFRRLPGSKVELANVGLGSYDISNAGSRSESAIDVLRKIKHLSQSERARIVMQLEQLVDDLPNDLMLTSQGVETLFSNGIEIGAHTHSHPILKNMDVAEATWEIQTSKAHLERLLGTDLKYFAYPNGQPGLDYTEAHSAIVEASGFSAAFSTRWGVISSDSERWELPRFTPWDSSPSKFILRLLLNYRKL